MGTFKYKAFISYSHKDERWARWLHRRLENYPIPSHLIGKQTETGEILKRLKPIFRDRDELAAADSLGEKIEAALASSQNLIVICSPNAAQSHWVNQEIIAFKHLNRGANIFSLIIDGEPFSSNSPNSLSGNGHKSQECFPKALRFVVGADGNLTQDPVEPLAADIRPHADGKRLGILKLVAGMISVDLDEIIQRDMRKTRKRVMAITATSLITVLAMGTLTGFALSARKDAEARRNDAEGLIEFMLTDLRNKLEPIGRLAILDSVAVEALDYYDSQDQLKLSCQAASRKASAYYLQAKINMNRKNMQGAQSKADAAFEVMNQHSKACQENSKFVIRSSHAEQWVAEPSVKALQKMVIDGSDEDMPATANYILERYSASELLLKTLKDNPENSFEYRYEMTDLHILMGQLFHHLKKYDDAKTHFETAHSYLDVYTAEAPDNQAFVNLNPERQNLITDKYADLLSWDASIFEQMGHYNEASKLYAKSQMKYNELANYDVLSSDNSSNQVDWNARYASVSLNFAQARLSYFQEKYTEAIALIERAEQDMEEILVQDEANIAWQESKAKIQISKEELMKIINGKEN